MRNVALGMLLLLLVMWTGSGQAQTLGHIGQTIYWQARMNDSCMVSLRTVVGKDCLVTGAHVVNRRSGKRKTVDCRNVNMQQEQMPRLAFTFTCDFEYDGLRYRLRGHFADSRESGGQQSVRCMPLTLGDEFLRQGGQGATRR